MNKIIYPSVDLFLYDLIYNLGELETEIEKNRKYFKSKLPEEIQEQLLIIDNDFAVEYVNLLKSIYVPFNSSNKYEGYYYPVRLGDTYGLLIDATIKEKNEPQLPDILQEIKQELKQNILKNKKGTIGQTWMISGWLSPSSSNNPEEIAKDWYEALMPDHSWEEEFDGEGKFLGASIFQLSSTRLIKQEIEKENTVETIIQNNQHVIIAIYPDLETLNLSGKFYANWMQLFHYQHKILWAYAQSRLLQKSIKSYFAQIKALSSPIKDGKYLRNKLKIFSLTLEEVEKLLNQYTTDLNTLDFQGGTITINLSNYQKRLIKINQKANSISNSSNNLKLLEEFTELVKDKYLLQIQRDSENLERGLRLLEDTISAIRSRVEVERVQNEKQFQDLITVIGTGVALATLAVGHEPKQDCEILFSGYYNIICQTSFLYALTLAFIASLITWLVKKIWHN